MTPATSSRFHANVATAIAVVIDTLTAESGNALPCLRTSWRNDGSQVTLPGCSRLRFIEVVQAATGQRVIGFMSGNQQSPDIMSEVFILAPTDLLEAHGVPASDQLTLG